MSEPTGTRTVGVELRAGPLHLLVLGRIVEEIVQVENFTAAERVALRLAIRETTALSMLDAVPGSPVQCEFRHEGEELGVRIRSVAVNDMDDNSHRLGWYALRCFIASVRMTQCPYDEDLGGYRTALQFTWRRRNSGPTIESVIDTEDTEP